MKHIIIIIFLLSILLHIQAADIDFGDFPANTPQKAQFTITNSLSYPLQILRVRSGCPCLEAVCDKKSLAPGEDTNLRVKLRPHSIIGQFTKTIYVEPDDPQQRFLRFELRGNAIPKAVNGGQKLL